MGKLSFYVSRWEHEAENNVLGEVLQSSIKDNAEYYHYEFDLDVYNSSNETRIMRDVRLCFRRKEVILFEDKPYDKSTKSIDGRFPHYEIPSPINIPPNSVLAVSLFGGIWKNGDVRFLSIWNVDNVVLAYKDKRDRDKKVAIVTVAIDSCLAGDERKGL